MPNSEKYRLDTVFDHERGGMVSASSHLVNFYGRYIFGIPLAATSETMAFVLAFFADEVRQEFRKVPLSRDQGWYDQDLGGRQ